MWLAVAASALLAVGMAACGGGSSDSTSTADSSSSESSGSVTESALATPVSAQELQSTLDETYGEGSVVPADLPRIVVDALEVASQPVTPELEDKVVECIRQSVCETGQGDVTIGIAEAFASNPWRAQYRAAATLQLLRYPQVSKIIFTDGAGELQKNLSNFNSLVSQGAKGIMGNMDFGAAMRPVARAAAARGVAVVSGPQRITGATADEVAADVGIDTCEYGRNSAEAIIEGSKKESGTIAIYTGTPGNPYGAEWIPCAEEATEEAGWEVALTGNTNWTPQGTQQAAAALLATGIPDGLIYDYTPNAFNEKILGTNTTPPAEAVQSGDYAFYQQWLDAAKDGHAFPAYLAASMLSTPYIQASILVEKSQGAGEDVPLHVVIPEPVVPAEAYRDIYNPSLPAGISFNSLLPDSLLAEVVTE